MVLCYACLHGLREWDTDHTRMKVREAYAVAHHAEMKDLLKAAAQGCFICHVYSRRLPMDRWEGPGPTWIHSININGFFQLDLQLLEDQETGPVSHHEKRNLEANFRMLKYGTSKLAEECPDCEDFSRQGGDAGKSQPAAITMISTLDHAALKLAKTWLDDCLESHDECNTGRQMTYDLPARLMDLECDSDDPQRWRLVDTLSKPHQRWRYMTLSHRWGPTKDTEPLKLNKNSEVSMTQSMLISDLPGTYREGIQIAKALGVRYFWIDSICIFQDNQLDIQKEAQNMGSVYGNSLCNIVALTARQDGIAGYRPSSVVGDSVNVCRHQSGLDSCYKILAFSIWKIEVESMPLLKRGWVAQERVLSRRALLCGPHQICWECRTVRLFQNSDPKLTFFDPPGIGKRLQVDGVPLISLPGNDHEQLHLDRPEGRAWLHFVCDYSTRDLTHMEDRLLAVSGIAKSIATLTGSVYLAGLWQNTLPWSLLWYQQGDDHTSDTDKPCSNKYVAPSWSWASVRTRVSPPSECQHCVAKFLGASIRSLGGDGLGSIVSPASLRLRGLLLDLVKHPDPLPPSMAETFTLCKCSHFKLYFNCLDQPLFERPQLERSTYALIVRAYRVFVPGKPEVHVKLSGLLLRPTKPCIVNTQELRKFCRVGEFLSMDLLSYLDHFLDMTTMNAMNYLGPFDPDLPRNVPQPHPIMNFDDFDSHTAKKILTDIEII